MKRFIVQPSTLNQTSDFSEISTWGNMKKLLINIVLYETFLNFAWF